MCSSSQSVAARLCLASLAKTAVQSSPATAVWTSHSPGHFRFWTWMESQNLPSLPGQNEIGLWAVKLPFHKTLEELKSSKVRQLKGKMLPF